MNKKSIVMSEKNIRKNEKDMKAKGKKIITYERYKDQKYIYWYF